MMSPHSESLHEHLKEYAPRSVHNRNGNRSRQNGDGCSADASLSIVGAVAITETRTNRNRTVLRYKPGSRAWRLQRKRTVVQRRTACGGSFTASGCGAESASD